MQCSPLHPLHSVQGRADTLHRRHSVIITECMNMCLAVGNINSLSLFLMQRAGFQRKEVVKGRGANPALSS